MPPALKVVYASYDGALDPLGASQVVPYLTRLAARGVSLSLVSFEKPERSASLAARERLAARLAGAGIAWRPLRYHKRPRLPATLLDVLAGARAIGREARRGGADIVHCRGDVAMVMARLARLPPGTRLLYDVRGFFSDERAESGSWRSGGLLDRLVRRCERGNLRRASGIVVLTEAAREILALRQSPAPPTRVIPTCADLASFTPRPAGLEQPFSLVYSGSLGTWYMKDEMIAFARASRASLPGRPLFLTPDGDEARRAGATEDWAEVRSAEPHEMPGWLQQAKALFFFIRPTPAKRASCPTKLGEGLAAGLPVVANRGIGDLDAMLEAEGVGVLLDGFGAADYAVALARLQALLLDPATSRRCRELAARRFDVDKGAAAYASLYQELAPVR